MELHSIVMQVKFSEFMLLDHDLLMDLVLKSLENMAFCFSVAGPLWKDTDVPDVSTPV